MQSRHREGFAGDRPEEGGLDVVARALACAHQAGGQAGFEELLG
ncbi:hypothetical protein SHIRM173S_09248 [Streptomyces hirsutus]